MLTIAALGACAALVAGCASGSRQDAGEPKATFAVQITEASFPARQTVARPVALSLTIRNPGTRTVPNVAVTLDSLYYISNYPELAAKKRPIWSIERGPGTVPKRLVESEAVAPPGSGTTAYVETWALGKLAPGATRQFRWILAPVKPGAHTVHYTVAAGLSGNAKARLTTGATPHGSFVAYIAPKPQVRFVNPNTGKVEFGTYPPAQ
jgi:hypothetical protein